MTVQEIADRLVELCRTGQFETAYQELFAADASAHEMPGMPHADVYGLDAMRQKAAAYDEVVAEILRFETTEPLVYGNHFAVGMGIQTKRKDGTTSEFEQEMAVYEVQDGKIKSERFIYSVPDQPDA